MSLVVPDPPSWNWTISLQMLCFFSPRQHMVRHGRIELLMHPLTQKYLAMKWQAYGRFCHMLSMLLYAVFVALVTARGVNLLGLVKQCPALLGGDGHGTERAGHYHRCHGRVEVGGNVGWAGNHVWRALR